MKKLWGFKSDGMGSKEKATGGYSRAACEMGVAIRKKKKL